MTGLASIAGRYTVRPGRVPSISGQRPIVQPQVLRHLLRGKQGNTVVQTLGSVFTLCAHAHRRVSALVWNAACADAQAYVAVQPLQQLRDETVRNHLQSMALDWPAHLALNAAQQAALLVWAHGVQNVAAQTPSPLDILATHRPLAERTRQACHALQVLNIDANAQATSLRAVAKTLQTNETFASLPQWGGQCAETGTWTRLRHGHVPPGQSLSLWQRLEARWQEVRALTEAPVLASDATHDPLLASGALALGPGQAIAWCEMARGLLLHWVQLGDDGAVADYRVLAPTEWNFHPQGAMAMALSALPSNDTAAAALMVAAMDACVECEVVCTK